MTWFCEMANFVLGENGELLEYCKLIANQATWATWMHSYGNDIRQLPQGMPAATLAPNYCFHQKAPGPLRQSKGRDLWPHHLPHQTKKLEELNQKRLAAGGDRVHYPGNTGTPTTNLLTVKLIINSIISTPSAKFMTMDIKDFYLSTPMTRYEHMQLHIADMPGDVIEHYKLTDLTTLDG
jgi:hypothetical protein